VPCAILLAINALKLDSGCVRFGFHESVPGPCVTAPPRSERRADPHRMKPPSLRKAAAMQGPHASACVHGDYIAVTFDDGPHATLTPALLDLLARNGIRATFFCLGKRVERYPEIVLRMTSAGHEIGNHSWGHPDLVTLTNDEVRSELQRTDSAIFQAAGVRPVLMRPPYGSLTELQCKWIGQEFGYKVILWNVDSLDWKEPGPDVIASRIVSLAKAGSIVLSHDIQPQTIGAMPEVLAVLLARGFKFATVSELLNLEIRGPGLP
jgi:peptidoglycan/xylan/chitin deacetylase (PgdA/CDA1 family)